MGRKLRLFFSAEPLYDNKNGVELHKGIRLFTMAQFLTTKGWAKTEIAIVDTGAPISLIPNRIWKRCQSEIIGETELKGVISKKECIMPVKVALIEVRLIEYEYVTQRLKIKAYLASIDEVPLIIGFENMLSKFNVFFSYHTQTAFIEEIE